MSENDGKVAIVTGAASGIGKATAMAFANSGAAVLLVDIDANKVSALSERMNAEGHRTLAAKCDVSNEFAVRDTIEEAVRVFGQLDFAYNNVGIHAPVVETADAEGSDFDRVIAVNLRGLWNCMKYELRHMRERQSGAIVNCSSQSGLVGTAGLGAYTASKHAVIGLTKCAALEYARKGIRVNAICPGTSDTPMVAAAARLAPEHMKKLIDTIPVGRMGQAEEIASLVLYLCTPQAGFITGQAIAADGGFTIS